MQRPAEKKLCRTNSVWRQSPTHVGFTRATTPLDGERGCWERNIPLAGDPTARLYTPKLFFFSLQLVCTEKVIRNCELEKRLYKEFFYNKG